MINHPGVSPEFLQLSLKWMKRTYGDKLASGELIEKVREHLAAAESYYCYLPIPPSPKLPKLAAFVEKQAKKKAGKRK